MLGGVGSRVGVVGTVGLMLGLLACSQASVVYMPCFLLRLSCRIVGVKGLGCRHRRLDVVIVDVFPSQCSIYALAFATTFL